MSIRFNTLKLDVTGEWIGEPINNPGCQLIKQAAKSACWHEGNDN